MNRFEGHLRAQFITKGDGAKDWTRPWGPSRKQAWRHKRRQAHLPCPSGWNWRLRLELKGSPWTGETRAQVEGQNEVFQDIGALRTDAQLLSATSECQKGLSTSERRQMMCQRSRVVYITHSTVPTVESKAARGTDTKLQISESFFAHGNIHKITDIGEQFSYKLCKHIPVKEGGGGREVLGVGRHFFPTSAAMECSPVIARSTHTGLFIPVQSPLNYILKGLKQRFASSNHHPKCSKPLDNTGNTAARPSSRLC